MSKCKKRKEEQNGTKKFSGQSGSSVQNIRNNEHFRKIVRKDKTKANLLKNKPPTPSDENSAPNSPSSTSDSDELRLSDDSGEIDVLSAMPIGSRSRRNQRKSSNPRKNHPISRAITIIDANFWSRVKACCGIIYENKDFNAVLIDVEHYGVNLCSIHDKKQIVPISYKEELSSVIKSLPPKKQHLHRQNMAESLQCTETIVQDAPIDYSIPSGLNKKIASQIVISYAQPQYNNVTGESSCSTNSPLNRTTKPIASKVTKKTVSRLLPKRGSNDVNSSKNLVKLCTDRNSIIHPNLNVPTCSPQGEHNENKNITNSANAEPVILNKYNDNSSDSGYEEIQQDTNHLNLIAAQSVIRATQVRIFFTEKNQKSKIKNLFVVIFANVSFYTFFFHSQTQNQYTNRDYKQRDYPWPEPQTINLKYLIHRLKESSQYM